MLCAYALVLAYAYSLVAGDLLFANIVAFVMVMGAPLCFFVAVLTNFGFGSSWRDGGRIQPVKRPFVGFATGILRRSRPRRCTISQYRREVPVTIHFSK